MTGCASHEGSAAPQQASADLPHPPGIAVDKVSELPAPAASGRAESGLVVLSEPPDTRPARVIVEAFFVAVTRESLDDLEQLFDRAARVRMNGKARPEAAFPWWRRRLDRLDYTTLGSDVVYRKTDLEIHTPESAAALRDRALAIVPRPGELVVRVTTVGPRTAQYFGPELTFLLHSTGAGYKIAEIVEDFRLP